MQTSDENKEKCQLLDYYIIWYQILQTNIMRIISQTVKRISSKILGVNGLMSVIQVLWCKLGEFGFGSTNNPLIDFFFFSWHYLSAWYHVDTVRRNSVLVSHGSLSVNRDCELFLNSQTIQQNTFYIFQMTNVRQFTTPWRSTLNLARRSIQSPSPAKKSSNPSQTQNHYYYPI